MSRIRSHIILIGFLLFTKSSTAQRDITGTWEGVMGRQIFQRHSGQFLQINIVQQGDKICGYTYDSVIAHPSDHCKAVFQGVYNKSMDLWILTGTSFIENTGNHVFMRIRLWNERQISQGKLEAEVGLESWPEETERAGSFFSGLFRVFGIDGDPVPQNVPEEIELKRISSAPPDMPSGIAPCFPQLLKSKDSLNSIVIGEKPMSPKSTDTVVAFVPKKDSVKQIAYTPPEVKKNDTVEIVQKMTERRRSIISHVPVDVKNITLNIYDNAIIDGDTVTIFYNGKLLVNKKLLSEKPIVIELALDEKAKTHEIVLYAENLGSIPPNTALVVVNAGDKRYELHASASLEENAVLVFDYSPKSN